MTWVYAVAAVLCLAGALGVVAARLPVHGVLALVLSFIGLAALYLSLSAEFMAVIQLIIYAGAIMVLFLFVIALLTARKDPVEREDSQAGVGPAAVGVGVLALLAGAALLGFDRTPADLPAGFGTVKAFGLELLRTHVLPFELTAFVLMVAVVGVIILVGRKPAQ